MGFCNHLWGCSRGILHRFWIHFPNHFQTISRPSRTLPSSILGSFFCFFFVSKIQWNLILFLDPFGLPRIPFPNHFQTISGPWTLPWWFLGHPWDPRRLGDVSGVPPGIFREFSGKFREASELHFGIIFYSFFASKIQWNLMLFLGFLQGSFWTSFCRGLNRPSG